MSEHDLTSPEMLGILALTTRGGAVAARWAHNPKVTGSSPVPATSVSGGVAQSVERGTHKPCVTSSILVAATREEPTPK